MGAPIPANVRLSGDRDDSESHPQPRRTREMTDERGTVKDNGTIHDRRSVAYWKQVGVIPRWQLVAVYTLVIAAGALGFQQTSKVAHRADDLSKQNKITATQAAILTREVARQRRDTILASCLDTNSRHDDVEREIIKLIPPDVDPAERARRVSSARRLAEAVAPKRDCNAVVEEATGG